MWIEKVRKKLLHYIYSDFLFSSSASFSYCYKDSLTIYIYFFLLKTSEVDGARQLSAFSRVVFLAHTGQSKEVTRKLI